MDHRCVTDALTAVRGARGCGMTSIAKPKIVHQGLKRNALGLTVRDYEGGMSTLCAGCGHDSITAAIVQAFFELDIAPHSVAKMSGIGCSSKTPAYFLSASHGFNSVHGRMPSIATGASAANRELHRLRRFRRRRFAVDRARAVHARAAPQSRHGVHHREQRRVRPHEGAVLGVGRRRLEGEARRGQQAAADRSRADRAGARRLVRRAELLGRQGAARAADQGGRAPSRLRADRRRSRRA